MQYAHDVSTCTGFDYNYIGALFPKGTAQMEHFVFTPKEKKIFKTAENPFTVCLANP